MKEEDVLPNVGKKFKTSLDIDEILTTAAIVIDHDVCKFLSQSNFNEIKLLKSDLRNKKFPMPK